MFTLFISLIAGAVAGWFFTQDLNSTGWGVFCGVAALFITQMLIALFIRFRRLLLRRVKTICKQRKNGSDKSKKNKQRNSRGV